MKKLLTIFAIAGVLVACNDSSTSNEGADSATTDSTIVEPLDTSAAGMGMDTTANRMGADSMQR
jgi:hypothetical protein